MQSLNREKKKKKNWATFNYNFMVFSIEAIHNCSVRYCMASYTIIVAWHTPYRPVNLCMRPTCHCGQWFQSFDNRMVKALPRLDLEQRLLRVCHARWRDSNLKKKQIKKAIRCKSGRKFVQLTQPLDKMLVHCKRQTLLSNHFSPSWEPSLSHDVYFTNGLLKDWLK